VLNVHAPTEDKIDDIKDKFYEELEQVFDIFPRYLLPSPFVRCPVELKICLMGRLGPPLHNEHLIDSPLTFYFIAL
jgi:hypothetical protein